MKYQCFGVNGYAGDRTPEAMNECHSFAQALSEFLGASVELHGNPKQARELPWEEALRESTEIFSTVRQVLSRSFAEGGIPILVTPRCASAIASLPVVVLNFPDVVIIYYAAHGDLHVPETSSSGYLGGMPITAAMGEWDSGHGSGLEANKLVHVGGRDLDLAERDFIRDKSIMTLSKKQIESGLGELKSLIQGRAVFIHIDTDVYDPSEVVAEYRVEDGLFRTHVDKVLSLVQSESQFVGMEITELSPKTNQEQERSYTALFDSFNSLQDEKPTQNKRASI